jgi:hypothetical protein
MIYEIDLDLMRCVTIEVYSDEALTREQIIELAKQEAKMEYGPFDDCEVLGVNKIDAS